jgi:ubiquinone/menaquinone biosynthesis C-methylase UbiE
MSIDAATIQDEQSSSPRIRTKKHSRNSAVVALATFLMHSFQSERPTWSNGAELNEIIRHPALLAIPPAERVACMMRSAQAKYESEKEYSWDHYFGTDLRPLLSGKRVMDLGSLYGGRSVAWSERYHIGHLTGVDVNPLYIEIASRFAESRQISADFYVAHGERLPFDSKVFDAIVTFDVLEHVQSVSLTLAECRRVLRPGGHLCAVFPSYWQPLEHHLSLVTRAPGLQFMFSGRTLVEAYNRVLDARGVDAAWYKRDHPGLRDWERCNTINGTTIRAFRKLVLENGWKIVKQNRPPIGSMGRTVAARPRLWHRGVAMIGRGLVRIPVLEEAFLHRAVFILQRD